MVLKGTCPNCRRQYVGWAMESPQHKLCNKCGTELKITNGRQGTNNRNHLDTLKERITDFLNTPIIPNHRDKNDNDHEEDLK